MYSKSVLKTPQKYNKIFFFYSDNYSQHWTEILQPAQAVHLIGNKSSIQRLYEWLEEWKQLIQSEAGKKNCSCTVFVLKTGACSQEASFNLILECSLTSVLSIIHPKTLGKIRNRQKPRQLFPWELL